MKTIILIIFAMPALWYIFWGLLAIITYFSMKPEYRKVSTFNNKSWGRNILEMLAAILFYYLLCNFL